MRFINIIYELSTFDYCNFLNIKILNIFKHTLTIYLLYYRDIYDKMKAEIRLMKEELSAIERYRTPKERSLAQCASSLEAMRATKAGLESELHQELMAQLSVADQHEVCIKKD